MHPVMAVLIGALTLAACAPAQAPSSFDGTYPGTGRFVSGSTGCVAREGSLRITMTVSGGEARIPLQGGAMRGTLAGRVGPDGNLGALAWSGTPALRDRSAGHIAAGTFQLDYAYDDPASAAVGCRYTYEGRRSS